MQHLAEQQHPPVEVNLVRVIRAPAKGRFICTVLSKHGWGCWSHWCGTHTEACFCTPEQREESTTKVVHRWKGFLHVAADLTGRHFFLEIASLAMRELMASVPEKEDMRGLKLEVSREPEHSRGAIVLRIVGRCKNERALAPERSPRATLEKLWKTKLPSGPSAA